MDSKFIELPNYDPRSPGLLGPLPALGNCLHDEKLDVDTEIWIDFDAPLFSGDAVVIFDENPWGKAPRMLGKWLQYTPDGRWWGVAYATHDADSLTAVSLDHPSFRIGGIAAMVARRETARAAPRQLRSDAKNRTPEAKRFFHDAGGAAIEHWNQHGYPPRAQFDFQTPEENRAVIRAWCAEKSVEPLPRFPFTLSAAPEARPS